MRSSAEGLPTFRALERPVPTVDYLVRHQVGGLMEVLATGATSELPLLVVRSEMQVQVGGGDEGFVAHGAAVRVQTDAPVGPSSIGEAAACFTGWTLGRRLVFEGFGVRVRRGEAEAASAI